MPFWLVNAKCYVVYVFFMFGWVADMFGFQTAKEKKLARTAWPESGQESGQKLAGLSAGLPWDFFENPALLTGQYPAKNPAGNPARFWPDSAVPGHYSSFSFFKFFFF